MTEWIINLIEMFVIKMKFNFVISVVIAVGVMSKVTRG